MSSNEFLNLSFKAQYMEREATVKIRNSNEIKFKQLPFLRGSDEVYDSHSRIAPVFEEHFIKILVVMHQALNSKIS